MVQSVAQALQSNIVPDLDFEGRPFHFLGVGGIGMSALAYILAGRSLPVSGSDTRASAVGERLADVGVRLFWQQSAANLEALAADWARPPQIICSSAIRPDNPEYQAAIAQGYPIFHRSDLLAALMAQSRGIAVAGTHGKTTTSSLLGYVLWQAGLDPTIIIGGEVAAWGGNARSGKSELVVAEADESDGSLVKLKAEIGIVTNIELDHPDHYASLDTVVAVFETFRQHCHTLVGCADCPTTRSRLKLDVTYGLDPTLKPDYWADEVVLAADGVAAQVWERGTRLGPIKLQLLGEHNLSNALAAIAVARQLGVDFGAIAAALASFGGAKRRFEHRGTIIGPDDGRSLSIYDDYAHHPSEIRATLAAARQRLAGSSYQRLVAAFQPHRYSRTQTFLEEFAASFSEADHVVIADVYGAGETSDGTLTGQTLADRIAAHHSQPGAIVYQPTPDQVRQYLAGHLQPGDLVLFLGAGNLNQAIPGLLADLEAQA